MAIDKFTSDVTDTFYNNTSKVPEGRYDKKLRLKTSDGTVIRMIRTKDITPTSTENDSVYVVTSNERYRPDIIAYNYYGTADLYWVILAANNLKTPFEVTDGLRLIIPGLAALYSSNGLLMR